METTDPKPGDTVTVEFGPSINSGKELTGVVTRITSDEIIINRKVYRWAEIVNIEVMDDDIRTPA